MILLYNKYLKPCARTLRSKAIATPAETLLWKYVRRKQINTIQFYRQKPIGNYIVDFYAPAAKLVIEVDGSQHDEPNQRAQDTVRDEFLNLCGLKVLRFRNQEVLGDINKVIEKIYQVVSD